MAETPRTSRLPIRLKANGTAFNPFSHNHSIAFIYNKEVAAEWSRRAAEFRRQAPAALAAATSAVWPFDYNTYGLSLPAGRPIDKVTRALMMPWLFDAFGEPRQRASAEAAVRHYSHCGITPPSHSSEKPLDELRARGFTRLRASWGFREAVVAAKLPATVGAMLDAAEVEVTRSQPGARRHAPAFGAVPGIEPLLALVTRHLLPLARKYLGDDARLDGYHAFRLMKDLGSTQYAPAHWHHDRCSHRLKAYVLLHAVEMDGHPLQIAAGSHRTLYYAYHRMELSRFSHEYVAANYGWIESMTTEQAGDGFLFDTNGIHRAAPGRGARHRDALLFEFNAASSARALSEHAGAPCPMTQLVRV